MQNLSIEEFGEVGKTLKIIVGGSTTKSLNNSFITSANDSTLQDKQEPLSIRIMCAD